MSVVTQIRGQLNLTATEARQTAQVLADFRQKFSQQTTHVQSLISGTATSADLEICEVLIAAAKSAESASLVLASAARSCRRYSDTI
jgi:hypothetical protein